MYIGLFIFMTQGAETMDKGFRWTIAAITLVICIIATIMTTVISSPGDTGNKASEVSATPAAVSAEPSPPAYQSLSFSVMGDIHTSVYTDADELAQALKDLNGINPGMDALILNGDTVDEGLEEYYKLIKNRLEENKMYTPKTIIKNIGNHEFYDYSKGENTPEDVQLYVSRYLSFSGDEKVYHDKWINGYHFISIGSEQSNTPELGGVQAFVSEEQLKWLDEKLAEEYKPGKPIFVFLHQPPDRNTAASRPGGWRGVFQSKELNEILSKYREIVLFTSHSHVFLTKDSMVNFKEPFTAIHTGAVHNPRIPERRENQYVTGSHGIYVEIKDGRLTVKGRDFKNKVWIEDAVFTSDLNQ